MKSQIIIVIIIPALANILIGQVDKELHISGVVRSEAYTPLPYANISIADTDIGTIADINGYFQLSVSSADSVKLVIQYIGYETVIVSLPTVDMISTPITITLKQTMLSFSPVEIVGESIMLQNQLIEPSLRFVRGEQMTTIPSVSGPDVFRSVQVLPGVQSSSEFSNQLYIRGGTPDQNLVLINGVPIYQPFHLFGLSSSIDAEAVDLMKYYSGGFSVRYGDRLSGVLDIITKPGTDSLKAKVDWNLLNIGATVSGRLLNHWRWRLSGRRTYFDYLSRLTGQDFPYKYSDLEGKLSYMPNPRQLFTINTFLSLDDYRRSSKKIEYNPIYEYHPDPAVAKADSNLYWKMDKSAVDWFNRLVSVRWTTRHSESAHTELTAYVSNLVQTVDNLKAFMAHDSASSSTLKRVEEKNKDYQYDQKNEDEIAETDLNDIGVNVSHDRQIRPWLHLNLGGGYSIRTLHYGWNTADFDVISPHVNVFMDFPPDTLDYRLRLTTVNGYIESTLNPFSDFYIRCGVRTTKHSILTNWIVTPRLNLTWKLAEDWNLKVGWGQFSQALSSSAEYGFYSVASLYFPTESNEVPQAAHTLAGLVYDNGQTLRLDLSFYKKDFDHQLYIAEDGTRQTGTSISTGIEALLTYRNQNRFSTQLAYACAVARKTQGPETFYPNYDQRHKLNLQVSLPFFGGRDINLLWSFSTGRPANLFTSIYYVGQEYWYFVDPRPYAPSSPWPFILRMPKNFLRYPAFHRLDIMIKKKRQTRRGHQLTTYLQIINLYARKNVVYYEDVVRRREKIQNDNGDPTAPKYKEVWEATSFNGFPFLPTIGFSYEF